MPDNSQKPTAVRASLLSRLFDSDDEIENLREQFYLTLRAYFAHVEANLPNTSSSKAVIEAQSSTSVNAKALTQVRALLESGRRPRWSECYEVEQLLVLLFDDAMLRTELEVRLLEAKSSLREQVYEYYQREALVQGIDKERRRTLLLRLVNDLQWRYTVQEGKRRFSKSLTTRTGVAFLLALVAFAGLVALAYMNNWQFAAGDLRLMYAAGVAGTWGATFSMLTGLKGRIDASAIYDLNVMRAVTMVTSRALVGAGAACVLYLFFCSGFVSGPAFPDLTPTKDDTLRPAVVALLVIWCFIAGFSEKLVPGLLAKAEGKVDGQVSPTGDSSPGRHRPTEPKLVGPSNGAAEALVTVANQVTAAKSSTA